MISSMDMLDRVYVSDSDPDVVEINRDTADVVEVSTSHAFVVGASLARLLDVDLTGLVDQNFLKYDAAVEKWVPSTPLARQIPFDNTTPGAASLTATDVQSAIEELISDDAAQYVTLGTAQTITGAKSFQATTTFLPNLMRIEAWNSYNSVPADPGSRLVWSDGANVNIALGHDGYGSMQMWPLGGVDSTVSLTLASNDEMVTGTVTSSITSLIDSDRGASIDIISPSSRMNVSSTGAGTAPAGFPGAELRLGYGSGGTLRKWSIVNTKGSQDLVIGTSIDFTGVVTGQRFAIARGGSTTVFSVVATSPAFVVKGAASQTSDLTQWQDSTGVTLASLGAGGALTASQGVFVPTNPAAYSLIIGQASGQSADPTVWQNYGGTTIARVDTTGKMWGAGYGLFATSVTSISPAGAGLFGAFSTTTVPLTVKAKASQTADLTQWQDSTGTVLTKVASDGRLQITKTGSYGPSETTGHFVLKDSGSGYVSAWSQTSDGLLRVSVPLSLTVISPSSQLLVTPGASAVDLTGFNQPLRLLGNHPSRITAIIQGQASQAADLTQWQDSTGTPLLQVTAGGRLQFGNNTNHQIYDSGDLNVTVGLNQFVVTSNSMMTPLGYPVYPLTRLWAGVEITSTGALTRVTEIVKAQASQTGDLTQWQRSDGMPVAVMTALGVLDKDISQTGYGGLAIRNGTTATGSTMNINGIFVQPPQTAGVGIAVRGVASQTADLQQWQNSAGNNLLRVASDGAIVGGSLSIEAASGRLGSQSGMGLVSTINAMYIRDTYATGLAVIRREGGGSPMVTIGGAIPGASTFYSSFFVQPSGVADIGVIVRGSGGQTADLEQWQASNGTVAGNVFLSGASRGYLGVTGGIVAGGSASSATAMVNALSTSATTIGMIVKGFTGQTANLQEWQDATGNYMVRVESNGLFRTANGVAVKSGGDIEFAGLVYPSGGGPGGRVGWTTQFASQVGQAIKGYSGQTANLSEWQNAAGVVLSRVQANGIVNVAAIGKETGTGTANDYLNIYRSIAVLNDVVGNVVILGRGASGQTGDLLTLQDGTAATVTRVSADGQNEIIPAAGTTPTMIVRSRRNAGDVTQNQNIVEFWSRDKLNSVPLGLMDYLGRWAVNPGALGGSFGPANTDASFQVSTRTTGAVGILVRGLASQSGDLQQWQNSSGTVLAKVGNDGSYTTTNGWITAAAISSATYIPPGGVMSFTAASSFLPSNLNQTPVGIKGASSTATITNKQLTSNVATLTTAANHGFSVGRRVSVSGIDATFNGNYTITAVTATTFSYAKTAADVASTASGGSATADTQVADPFLIQNGIGENIARFNVAQQFLTQDVILGPATNIGAGGATLRWRRANQTESWYLYTPDDPNLYFRDIVNARMVLTLNPSATQPQVAIDGTMLSRGASAAGNQIVAKAVTGQTGDLIVAQDSTGSPFARITSTGMGQFGSAGTFGASNGISLLGAGGTDWRIFADTGPVLKIGGNGGTTNFWTGAWTNTSPANLFTSPNAQSGQIVAAVRGVAGQTADLFQVQNNAGTALAWVANDGHFYVNTAGQGSAATFTSTATTRLFIDSNGGGNAGFGLSMAGTNKWSLASYKPSGTNFSFVFYNEQHSYPSFFIEGDTDRVGIGIVGPTAQLDVRVSTSTATVGAVLRGMAAQTGDLLQAQNSSGTVLFAIDPIGLPNWMSNTQTTVGAAGAASPLPASPSKYLKVKDGSGVTYVVPAFASV